MEKLTITKKVLEKFTATSTLVVIPYKNDIIFTTKEYKIFYKQPRNGDTIGENNVISFSLVDIISLTFIKDVVDLNCTIQPMDGTNIACLIFTHNNITEKVKFYQFIKSSIPAIVTDQIIPSFIVEDYKEMDEITPIPNCNHIIKLSEYDPKIESLRYYLYSVKQMTNTLYSTLQYSKLYEIKDSTIKNKLFILPSKFNSELKWGITLNDSNASTQVVYIYNDNCCYIDESSTVTANIVQLYEFWIKYEDKNKNDIKDISYIIPLLKEIHENKPLLNRIKILIRNNDKKIKFNHTDKKFQIIHKDGSIIDLSMNIDIELEKTINISPVLLLNMLNNYNNITNVYSLSKKGSDRSIYKLVLKNSVLIIY